MSQLQGNTPVLSDIHTFLSVERFRKQGKTLFIILILREVSFSGLRLFDENWNTKTYQTNISGKGLKESDVSSDLYLIFNGLRDLTVKCHVIVLYNILLYDVCLKIC